MKKTPFILGAAALVAAFLLYVFGAVPTGNCMFDFGNGISMSEANGKSPNQIGQLLTEKWLKSYQSVTSCPGLRAADYKVNYAELSRDLSTNDSEYRVGFDVEMPFGFLAGQDWVAGNGIADGRWVRGKLQFAIVHKDADGYRFTSMATSPY